MSRIRKQDFTDGKICGTLRDSFEHHEESLNIS